VNLSLMSTAPWGPLSRGGWWTFPLPPACSFHLLLRVTLLPDTAPVTEGGTAPGLNTPAFPLCPSAVPPADERSVPGSLCVH
jgi:hypothetical protein